MRVVTDGSAMHVHFG